MVRNNENDIKGIDDLNGKVVAVKSGTGSVDYAKAHIKTKDLRQFPNIDNAYMELGTNRADAVLHDTPNILYFIHTAGKGRFKAVGDSIEAQYGIAFPKGSDDLRESEWRAETLHDNGTYNTIYKNGSAANLNNSGLTPFISRELCSPAFISTATDSGVTPWSLTGASSGPPYRS